MKASKFLRKAAEKVAEQDKYDSHCFACIALLTVRGERGDYARAMKRLIMFKPKHYSVGQPWFGTSYANPIGQQRRVLALLLAAEIAEAAGD